MPLLSTCLGYPRDGLESELQRAITRFRNKETSALELKEVARKLAAHNWSVMQHAGIDHIPSNDLSFADPLLDTASMLGLIPRRFREIACPVTRYVAMAYGLPGHPIAPLERATWFGDGQRHAVPELDLPMGARLDIAKLMGELDHARSLGIPVRPVLLGPVSFLMSSRGSASEAAAGGALTLLNSVLEAYAGLLTLLYEEGVGWVQLDEPLLVHPLSAAAGKAYVDAFAYLSWLTSRPKVLLTTYFGALGANLPLALGSGFEGLHVDLVTAPDQLDQLLDQFPARMTLSAGVVDGRSISASDHDHAAPLLQRAVDKLGQERVWVAPSCSLAHLADDAASDAEGRAAYDHALAKLETLHSLAAIAGSNTNARYGGEG